MTVLPVSIPRGAPVPARAHALDAGIDLYAGNEQTGEVPE